MVTDSEKIQRACKAIADDIAAGNADVLGEHLADEVWIAYNSREFGPLGRQQVVMHLRLGLKLLKISEIEAIKLRSFSIEVDGDEAVCELVSMIASDAPDTGGRPVLIAWELEWVKQADGWRIRLARARLAGAADLAGN